MNSTLNVALPYTGHLFTSNGQFRAWNQQLEQKIRAPECKFTNSLCYHTQRKMGSEVAYTFRL